MVCHGRGLCGSRFCLWVLALCAVVVCCVLWLCAVVVCCGCVLWLCAVHVSLMSLCLWLCMWLCVCDYVLVAV